MFELVCVTYIFPVRACDCLWCLPESTGALAVLCGVSGSGSDVAVGCLVCMFLGDLFPVGFGRLALFSCDFWVANVTSEKVLVYEIPTFWLSGNRQEKARKWSLIFSKLNFTVWSKCCGYFMFFIFELQLWKKLVFWICFYVVWQFSVASDKVLYLFGNQVGEGQRKLLGINCFKHSFCYNFFSCDEAGVLDLHVCCLNFFSANDNIGLFGMKLNWVTTQIVERRVCLLWKSGLLSKFIIRQV